MAEILTSRIINVHGLVNDFENVPVQAHPYDYDVMELVDESLSIAVPSTNIFLLWCSVTNSYIASFTAENSVATVHPNLQVKLQHPNGSINFKLYSMTTLGVLQPESVGALSLSLSFIKYKQN